MNDAAYDISHLLELEAVAPPPPEFRSAKPVEVKVKPPSLAEVQEAMARELLQQMDIHHEQMIAQYQRMRDDSLPDSDW